MLKSVIRRMKDFVEYHLVGFSLPSVLRLIRNSFIKIIKIRGFAIYFFMCFVLMYKILIPQINISEASIHIEPIEKPVQCYSSSDKIIGKDMALKLPAKTVYTINDFNMLTKEELICIKGIGNKTAGLIIEYKNINGDFKSFEQLLEIKGIGEKKLISIKNQLKVFRNRKGGSVEY